MLYKPHRNKRTAATAVEASIALPVTFFAFLGIMIGGMGIFKYQEMAHVARETARFAAVHGAQYAKDNAASIAAGTLPNVDHAYLTAYAKNLGVSLDTSLLQITVQMTVLKPGATSSTTTETVGWDNTTENQSRSPYSAWTDQSTTPPSNLQQSNVVMVQVTYPWSPGLFGIGTITLTSTAVMPMSY